MAKNRWDELSPATRKLIVGVSVLDAVLKLVALIDLARRPSSRVKGTKPAWAAALVAINSAGLLPLGYLVFGRRRD